MVFGLSFTNFIGFLLWARPLFYTQYANLSYHPFVFKGTAYRQYNFACGGEI